MAQSKPIKTILVFDLEGSGYNILWTLDGVTWVAVARTRMLNAAERDGYLERYQSEQPQVEVRHVEDFYGRIPEDLVVEGTRVI
jgi:hypothetical protein